MPLSNPLNFLDGINNLSESLISLFFNELADFKYIDRFVRLEVGLATGYSGGDIVPFMRYTDRGWFIAPAYEFDRNNIGLTLGYEWKLK